MADDFTLSEDAMRRLGRVVHAFEGGGAGVSAARLRDGPTYALVVSAPSGGGPYHGVLSATPDGLAWTNDGRAVNVRAVNGEALAVGERYRADHIGYAPDGTPILLAVATCCGSSSGSGGILTPCCPGYAMPATLCVTVTGATGSYAYALGKTFALTYHAAGGFCFQGTLPAWFGNLASSVSGAQFGIEAWLVCSDTGSFGMYFYGWNGGSYECAGMGGSVATCAPFAMTCSGADAVGTLAFSVAEGACPPGCGDSSSATLTATITGATGCYADAPPSFTMPCTAGGSGPSSWRSPPSMSGVCGVLFDASVTDCTAATPFMVIGSDSSAPDPGWTCSPFSAVYHMVNGGTGATCTVTVVG